MLKGIIASGIYFFNVQMPRDGMSGMALLNVEENVKRKLKKMIHIRKLGKNEKFKRLRKLLLLFFSLTFKNRVKGMCGMTVSLILFPRGSSGVATAVLPVPLPLVF